MRMHQNFSCDTFQNPMGAPAVRPHTWPTKEMHPSAEPSVLSHYKSHGFRVPECYISEQGSTLVLFCTTVLLRVWDKLARATPNAASIVIPSLSIALHWQSQKTPQCYQHKCNLQNHRWTRTWSQRCRLCLLQSASEPLCQAYVHKSLKVPKESWTSTA
jgi:hypothetical protein